MSRCEHGYLLRALTLAMAMAMLAVSTIALASGRTLQVTHNPILADGQYYSADPAPLVADGQLYILAGRDEAPDEVNDFIMREWQMLVSSDVDSGRWQHYPALLRPEQVFAWAAPGRAYASQIVQGPDQRYYLYAAVEEHDSRNQDKFGIGVAVAEHPLGPWRDAHPGGPIVSQSQPEPNAIQNIDPTVLVDDDGRVYLYWGTFGQLRAIELDADMVSSKGRVRGVDGLRGFFEAPWLFKRGNSYYLAYAANNAGVASECTPTLYHACIAYASAPTPLGPWTYQGVLLGPVSSTTSHPGIVQFKGQWYLCYHTADGDGGGHFRRSVAIDKLQWDDSVQPARLRPLTPTRRPPTAPVASRNLAAAAHASASNSPDIPLQYWIAALNDGVVKHNPLPPQMWGSWTANNPPQQWIQYSWQQPVTLNGSGMMFFADQPAGSGIGVAAPQSWRLQYRHQGQWLPVPAASDYDTTPGRMQQVSFAAITTRCVRAVFDASTDGHSYAAVAVQEWQMLAPHAQRLPATADAQAALNCDVDGETQ